VEQPYLKPHFVGVGGIGMSALAHLWLQRFGRDLSGSDSAQNQYLNSLADLGASISVGHKSSNVNSDVDVLIYSSAISADNIERLVAAERGIPQLHRSALLAQLMHGKETLLVTGSHGKTSTSALLSWTMLAAGWGPSFALGGSFQSIPDHSLYHGHWCGGLYFVAEADESDGTFLDYRAHGAIITNCEPEHLDYFGTWDRQQEAFRCFGRRVSRELLFWCADDVALHQMGLHGQSYGFAPDANWRITQVISQGWKTHLDIVANGHEYSAIEIPLLGIHQATNAAAVFALLRTLGMSEADIRRGFSSFPGVKRRCEILYRHSPVVVHDYAHHPTEIATTLRALRAANPHERMMVIFQPHRYSRTRDFAREFGIAFDAADFVAITDIYAASERPIAGIGPHSIIDHIPDRVPARHLSLSDGEALLRTARDYQLIVFMGAGDIACAAERFGKQLATSAGV